jgi:multiple sugar transport system substrate-binding protein
MKKIRIVGILTLMVLMVLSLPGCKKTDKGTAETEKKVEEVFFFSSVGAYQKLLEEQVRLWNEGAGAQKGVRIVMETNIDNYNDALQAMIQSGTWPDLFDSYNRPDFISAGWTRNLYDIPEVADLVERFKPYFMQGTNLRGNNLVALPLEIVPIKIVYNKEIFAKAGLTAPPKTWDEMIDYAKKITQAGNGEFYGFGWTSMFTVAFRRQAMKATMSSTGVGYFNNNIGAYDFRPFKPVIEAIARMYQDGSMFPSPLDQNIDPIRNRFAEGRVGMEIAPAYDIAVYNIQFPCNFDWGVAEVPSYTPGGLKYKGVALNRANISISSHVSQDRMWAVSEAFHFMHSEELYKKLYANSSIIPHEEKLITGTQMENALKNWDVMSDIANYTYMPPFPDALLTLEGDSYEATFNKIMLGNSTFDAEVDALNKRYNDAYQKAKAQGVIAVEIYETPFDMTRD